MLIEKICENCQNIFNVRKGTHGPTRFCCPECWYDWVIKHPKPKKVYSEEEIINLIKKKFEEKVIRKEGCWDWDGYCDPCGYPRFTIRTIGKIRGHQASYLIYKGKLVKGKYICHRCNNSRCTNPDHIYLGTPQDNVRDMIESGRRVITYGLPSNNTTLTSAKGSKNGSAVLDELKVRKIKKMLFLGISCIKIAKEFGVGKTTIYRIKYGTHWTHVN